MIPGQTMASGTHPIDCPNWEYEHVNDYQLKLFPAVVGVLSDLRGGKMDAVASACDTRPIHQRFFRELVAGHEPYLAGNYRGSANLRCLQDRPVVVGGASPAVGFPPSKVLPSMATLARKITETVVWLHERRSSADPAEFLADLATETANILELFLRVHPYANGNGHSGRYLTWALTGHFDNWPRRLSVEPKPSDPRYIVGLREATNSGDLRTLASYILDALLPD